MTKPICKPPLVKRTIKHQYIETTMNDSNLIKRQLVINYVNGREVSLNISVKVRSHPGATVDYFIDYVRPTARKKPNLMKQVISRIM